MMVTRMAYRARQFFRALTAPLAKEEVQEIEQVLTPAAWTLFSSMPPADRQHGLKVYRALQARGPQPSDLLAAALLHDAGKTAVPFLLWTRVAAVLIERLAPRLLERLKQKDMFCCRPLTSYLQHAQTGAEWAAQAGCSPLTVSLIRRHHEPTGQTEGEEDRLLMLLQETDKSC